MIFDNSDEAQSWCQYWLKRLSLSDWTVVVKVCRAKELAPGNEAQVQYVRSSKTAIVSIMCKEDYDNSSFPLDHEINLVHELMHLLFCPFMDEEKESEAWINQEWAIEATARALVDVRRNPSEGMPPYIPGL